MKSKINVGVIFTDKISSGGGFQQSINAALKFSNINLDFLNVIHYTTVQDNIQKLNAHGIKAQIIEFSKIGKLINLIRQKFSHPYFSKLFKFLVKYNSFEKKLIEDNIDLVYFLSPCSLPLHLDKLNFITTVWDLCHREQLEFPEVRDDYEFQNREKKFKDILPRATAIISDSERGKNNISKYYGVDLERIYVMPFGAANTIKNYKPSSFKNIDIKKKYELNFQYLYYPAQFWPHKNHIYILYALKILETNHNMKIGAIFSGGDKGNVNYIKSNIKALNLEDRVKIIGFVENNEIPYLYGQSLALVMPTYFGPTNMPPIEAFKLKVPVLYSNLPGLKDQVKNAALLLNLNDPESLSKAVLKIINDKELVKEMINNGEKIYKKIYSDQTKNLKKILTDFKSKRITWN